MKAYGLPRNHDVSSPDVADIHTYGLKTSLGHPHRATQKSASKARARRIWKKKARRDGKQQTIQI